MARTQNTKLYRIWLYFLASSIPLLLLPALVMLAIYWRSIDVINQQTYEKNLATLKNSADIIEKSVENIDNVICYIGESPGINKFLLSAGPHVDGTSTIDILNAQKELRALNISNNLFNNIQVYSLRNDSLIDSSASAISLRYYYQRNFFIQGYTYDQWYEAMLIQPHHDGIYSDMTIGGSYGDKKQIVYAQSLPLTLDRRILGNVFVFLDEEYILSLFDTIPYHDGGCLSVLDEDGKVFLGQGVATHLQAFADCLPEKSGYFLEDIGGDEMFVTYYRGNIRDWTYVAAIPKDLVLSPTAGIRTFITMMILLSILLDVLLAFYIAYRLSRPVTNIYKVLTKRTQPLSYGDFEYEISKLVHSNEVMREALSQQIPALKTSVFYNLLFGGYQSREDMQTSLSRIDINFQAKYYVVLLASLNELDSANITLQEISAQKVYINQVITRHLSRVEGIYDLDFERTVLLVSSDDPDYVTLMESLEQAVSHVLEEASRSTLRSISFSGDITDDIMKIPVTFLHAQAALDYPVRNPDFHIQWYNKAHLTTSQNFYYPLDMESQFIHAAKNGEVSALSSLFEKLSHANRNIIHAKGGAAFLNLLKALNSTLIRIYNELPEGESGGISGQISRRLEDGQELLDVFYLLQKAFSDCAIASYERRSKENLTLQAQIRQYVDSHYADSQLSLASVAGVFHITEVYLSRLFKQSSNENFSKYIERLRMEQANLLIKEKHLLLNEIAPLVGYNSPQAFRRAYKRFYGIPPSEYQNGKAL